VKRILKGIKVQKIGHRGKNDPEKSIKKARGCKTGLYTTRYTSSLGKKKEAIKGDLGLGGRKSWVCFPSKQSDRWTGGGVIGYGTGSPTGTGGALDNKKTGKEERYITQFAEQQFQGPHKVPSRPRRRMLKTKTPPIKERHGMIGERQLLT